jgi:hypothetical protein
MLAFEIDPDQAFNKVVKDAIEKVGDLRPVLMTISRSWYKSNKAIFALKGPGKYVDLTEKYAEAKAAKLGSAYPILRGFTRRLEGSITEAGSADAIAYVINKRTLVLGTRTPYAGYLHEGTSKMKARPVLLLGAEQVAPEAHQIARGRWIASIEDFVREAAGDALGG